MVDPEALRRSAKRLSPSFAEFRHEATHRRRAITPRRVEAEREQLGLKAD